MNIQWFPGHMAKTRRILTENLKIVDVVIELLDARIPISSRNPEFDKILNNKIRVVALNKSDLADDNVSNLWNSWFTKNGVVSIFIDSIKGTGFTQLKNELKNVMKDKLEREKERGRITRPIRTMIVGIPNVGKSSFINKMAGKKSAQTGDKPGVTRGKQWIRLNSEIDLLDTPGILWPKFEDINTGLHLAYTGAIKDEVIDTIEVASALMLKLKELYPQILMARYKLETLDFENGIEILEAAGRKRGCLISGGEVDFSRISSIVLDEFRGAKIGRISLERPIDLEVKEEKTNE